MVGVPLVGHLDLDLDFRCKVFISGSETRRAPSSHGRMTGVLLVERKRGDNRRRQGGGLAAKCGIGRRRRRGRVYEVSKPFVSTMVDWVQII